MKPEIVIEYKDINVCKLTVSKDRASLKIPNKFRYENTTGAEFQVYKRLYQFAQDIVYDVDPYQTLRGKFRMDDGQWRIILKTVSSKTFGTYREDVGSESIVFCDGEDADNV